MTKQELELVEMARSQGWMHRGRLDELLALIDRLALIEEKAAAVVHDWNTNGFKPTLAATLFNLRAALAAKEEGRG